MISKYEGSFKKLVFEWTGILEDGSRYVDMEYVEPNHFLANFTICYLSKKQIYILSE